MTGQPLVLAMRDAGLTTPALARLLDVSVDTVSSWRQARRHPCCGFMRAELARILTGSEKGGK